MHLTCFHRVRSRLAIIIRDPNVTDILKDNNEEIQVELLDFGRRSDAGDRRNVLPPNVQAHDGSVYSGPGGSLDFQ